MDSTQKTCIMYTRLLGCRYHTTNDMGEIEFPAFSSCCEILVYCLEAECIKVPRPYVKQEKHGICIDDKKNCLSNEAHYIKFNVSSNRSLFSYFFSS
jgi:hypothetical protein